MKTLNNKALTHKKVLKTLSKHTIFDADSKTCSLKDSHDSYLIDLNGKKYLDMASSFGSMPLGYNHPVLCAKMLEHPEVFINKIANGDLYTEFYEAFVDKFFQNVPKEFTRAFFIDNGTNACDAALKCCFDFYAKKHNLTDEQVNDLDIVSFYGGFHGRCGLPVSLTSTDPNKTKLYPKHKFTKIIAPSIKLPINIEELERLESQSLSALENALKTNKVVACIFEPLLSEGGNMILSSKYLQEVRNLTKQYDTFLIFDEIQTGMGMSGKYWLGADYYGVMPDIMCVGKKLQVSGFTVSDKINEIPCHIFNDRSRISSTFGGSTIDMLRATIVFDIINEEKLLENAHIQGEYLLNGIYHVTKNSEISNIRGIGLLIAFDLPNTEKRDKLLNDLNEKIYCLPAGAVSIRLRPFLNITKKDCDLFLNILEDTITE